MRRAQHPGRDHAGDFAPTRGSGRIARTTDLGLLRRTQLPTVKGQLNLPKCGRCHPPAT